MPCFVAEVLNDETDQIDLSPPFFHLIEKHLPGFLALILPILLVFFKYSLVILKGNLMKTDAKIFFLADGKSS